MQRRKFIAAVATGITLNAGAAMAAADDTSAAYNGCPVEECWEPHSGQTGAPERSADDVIVPDHVKISFLMRSWTKDGVTVATMVRPNEVTVVYHGDVEPEQSEVEDILSNFAAACSQVGSTTTLRIATPENEYTITEERVGEYLDGEITHSEYMKVIEDA